LTKIVVSSDLHLGITPPEVVEALAKDIAAEQPDLTVLAGDLGEGLINIVRCLALVRAVLGEVAMLAGNHDVWAREGHFEPSAVGARAAGGCARCWDALARRSRVAARGCGGRRLARLV